MTSLKTSLSCGLGLLLILSACEVATDRTSGGTCVDIEPSAYDQSCKVDSDCVAISTGDICSGYDCACPNGAISAGDQARYEQAVSSVEPGPGPLCECPALGSARCLESKCTFSAITPRDAGPDSAKEGGGCVDIEPSSFDQSCKADSDCVAIGSGDFCPLYECACPNAAINADGQTRYEQELSSVPRASGAGCECPALGSARCVQSKCAFVTGTGVTHP